MECSSVMPDKGAGASDGRSRSDGVTPAAAGRGA